MTNFNADALGSCCQKRCVARVIQYAPKVLGRIHLLSGITSHTNVPLTCSTYMQLS